MAETVSLMVASQRPLQSELQGIRNATAIGIRFHLNQAVSGIGCHLGAAAYTPSQSHRRVAAASLAARGQASLTELAVVKTGSSDAYRTPQL